MLKEFVERVPEPTSAAKQIEITRAE